MRLVVILAALALVFAWTASFVPQVDLLPGRPKVTAAQPANAGGRSRGATEAPVTPVAEPAMQSPPPLFRAATPPTAAPRPGETFALVGLVSRPNRRTAFLRDQATGQVFVAVPGGGVAEWTLRRLDNDCASLVRGRKVQRVCR